MQTYLIQSALFDILLTLVFPEPFRGGRGGRGAFRGGRGGFANVNGGAPTKANGLTSTATTTEGWANQVEQATTGASGEDGGDHSAEAPRESSKADDFAAAGGMADAPAAKEVEAAAKQGGTSWQEEIKRPVPAAIKPKMTWAQIAR